MRNDLLYYVHKLMMAYITAKMMSMTRTISKIIATPAIAPIMGPAFESSSEPALVI